MPSCKASVKTKIGMGLSVCQHADDDNDDDDDDDDDDEREDLRGYRSTE